MPHNRLDTTDAILPAPSQLPAFSRPLEPPPASLMRFAHNASELCALASDWQPSTARTIWLAEPKVDGIRALWIGGKVCRLLTREGNMIGAGDCVVDPLNDLEAAFGKPMFFDGEIAHPDGFEATLASFRRGVPDPALTLWLFDAVPLDVWAAAGRTAPLGDRKAALRSVFGAGGRPAVGLLKGEAIDGRNVQAAAQDRIARGLEGIVLKDATSPYVRGRGADWRRIKALATTDAQVITVKATETGAKLGCRIALTPAGCCFWVSFPAGKGAPLLPSPGAVIEIAHNGFTAKGTPRHARFVRVTAKRSI